MLFDATPRVFSAEDNQVMQSLAMHASLAIDNARLRVQAVAAAAEEERSRLARELHDSVSQALFGISLGMNTALLRSRVLDDAGIPHAFTTREGGVSSGLFASLNFGNPAEFTPEQRDPPSNIAENWRRTLAAAGLDPEQRAEQIPVDGFVRLARLLA